MNRLSPAPGGAFATQDAGLPPRPQMADAGAVGGAGGPPMAPSDPSSLMAKLAAMGLLGGAPGGGPTMPGMGQPPTSMPGGSGGLPGGIGVPTAVQPPGPQSLSGGDPFSELEGLLGKLPPVDEMPVRPRRTKFKPGQPGQPKSGMRAHEILNNPDMVSTLQQRLLVWESENPGKKLMGSHIQQMLPEVSAAQARTIKRLLDKALNKNTAVDMKSLMERGSAAALKKG